MSLAQTHGRMSRDIPGVGPVVVSDPKYYQNDNLIRKETDFTMKF